MNVATSINHTSSHPLAVGIRSQARGEWHAPRKQPGLANGESWNNAEWNEQSHALVFEFVQTKVLPRDPAIALLL